MILPTRKDCISAGTPQKGNWQPPHPSERPGSTVVMVHQSQNGRRSAASCNNAEAQELHPFQRPVASHVSGFGCVFTASAVETMRRNLASGPGEPSMRLLPSSAHTSDNASMCRTMDHTIDGTCCPTRRAMEITGHDRAPVRDFAKHVFFQSTLPTKITSCRQSA